MQPQHKIEDHGQTSVAIAIQMFGGVAMLSTPAALKLAGWPGTSHEAICLARREGRLPVEEEKHGSRYYVTAAAFARAFLMVRTHAEPAGDGVTATTTMHRSRGRPPRLVLNEMVAS